MTFLLETKGLCANYGTSRILNSLDIHVNNHGITTLLGANGAGKTTTLRAICNMMVQTQGDVLFEGRKINARNTEDIVRMGIAHVPDGRGTFTQFTVDENLRLGAYTCRKSDFNHDLEKVFAYFPRLKDRRKQQAGTLSGGEQQMLAISRALMLRPKLLLLDEPSFGLAPLVVQDIFKILESVNHQEGVSMLLVEQNAKLALDLADHAFVLENGRVVTSGSADAVKNDTAIQRAYLGY
jgi:branched-chain amino acid transport system ATP-binding protein